MNRFTHVERIDDGRAIAITDNAGITQRFHSIWLRDNALDPDTRAPENGQKLITLSSLPADVRISAASLDADGDVEIRFEPEGKQVRFPAEWLSDRAYDRTPDKTPGWLSTEIQTWDATLESVPSAELDQLKQDQTALRDWLTDVRRCMRLKVR